MRFICQIALDREPFLVLGGMTYLFMSDFVPGELEATWDPDAGENALIVQPGDPVTGCVPYPTGPTLCRIDRDSGLRWPQNLVPCEFQAELIAGEDPDDLEETHSAEDLGENKLGGIPLFLQGEPEFYGKGWSFLMQLDESSLPFSVNFGTGFGYALLSSDGRRGRFLWQC